jgi:hypothetical protein
MSRGASWKLRDVRHRATHKPISKFKSDMGFWTIEYIFQILCYSCDYKLFSELVYKTKRQFGKLVGGQP